MTRLNCRARHRVGKCGAALVGKSSFVFVVTPARADAERDAEKKLDAFSTSTTSASSRSTTARDFLHRGIH